MVQAILGTLISLIALFLVFLVLIQKGKGGGLAGAFGAPGGASAFGTKAGDMFMYITIVVAAVWIMMCVLTIFVLHQPSLLEGGGETNGRATIGATADPDASDDDAESEDAESQDSDAVVDE